MIRSTTSLQALVCCWYVSFKLVWIQLNPNLCMWRQQSFKRKIICLPTGSLMAIAAVVYQLTNWRGCPHSVLCRALLFCSFGVTNSKAFGGCKAWVLFWPMTSHLFLINGHFLEVHVHLRGNCQVWVAAFCTSEKSMAFQDLAKIVALFNCWNFTGCSCNNMSSSFWCSN